MSLPTISATPKGAKKSKAKGRKIGRNDKVCAAYKASGRRDAAKIRNIVREMKKALRNGHIYTAPGWEIKGENVTRKTRTEA